MTPSTTLISSNRKVDKIEAFPSGIHKSDKNNFILNKNIRAWVLKIFLWRYKYVIQEEKQLGMVFPLAKKQKPKEELEVKKILLQSK